MCLISVVSVSLEAYSGCNWLCDCPDEPAFSNSFSTSGCSSNDNWCWQTYTSGAFYNDRLNPTATFGVDCCGWHSGGEGSGSVQLAINEIAAPIPSYSLSALLFSFKLNFLKNSFSLNVFTFTTPI